MTMQPSGTMKQQGLTRRDSATRPEVPLLARFLGKFVLDVMPTALASVIGGFLITQYQFGHPRPAAALEQVTPASAEMMALVRDEHAMIINYLTTQMAAEKGRQTAEDASPRETADASAPAADVRPVATQVALEASARRIAAVQQAARPAPSRAKASVPISTASTAPVLAQPLVIAQADPNIAGSDNGSDRPARDPNSILAKTIDLKDHVVAATRHVVGMIGDVFDSVGERLGSETADTRQFSSESWRELPQ